MLQSGTLSLVRLGVAAINGENGLLLGDMLIQTPRPMR